MKKSARHHAFNILYQFYKQPDRLNRIRNDYFFNHPIDSKDISRVLVLTNEVVRWQGRLDGWITSKLNQPMSKLNPSIQILLRLGYYEALMDNSIPIHAAVHSWVELTKDIFSQKLAGLVNAVMRKTENIHSHNRPDEMTLFDWQSFPHWMVENWIKQFGEQDTHYLCDYYNQVPEIDVRMNLWKSKKSEIESTLNDMNVSWKYSPNSIEFIRISGGVKQLLQSDMFQEGIINIQNRASGGVVDLLNPQPGELILDVCAAPGTKTSYIVEKMHGKGKVIASDISKTRIEKGESRSDQIDYPIIWMRKDASTDQFSMADRILIDAPCTGTGVIGRRPDIRWRRNRKDTKSIVELQKSILKHMCKFLNDGGVMIYSTCSLEGEENWNVVESFLKLNNNFFLESAKDFVPDAWLDTNNCLATFPPRDYVDGMFAAKLRKNDK